MRRPIHKAEARRLVAGVGTVVALALIGAVGFITQTGGSLPAVRYTYVKAKFESVGTLTEGKPVAEHGIHVGVVSDIEFVDGSALVTLRLDGDKDVYKDASLSIANASALGKKYVSFESGTAAAGPLGDAVLDESHTKRAAVVEDIFTAFDPRTQRAARGTIYELSGISGHSNDLHSFLSTAPSLLADFETIAGALTTPRAELPGTISSAQRIVGRFKGSEPELARLLQNAEDTVGALSVDQAQPLSDSVAMLPSTLTDAKKALDDLRTPLADTDVALAKLQPGARALGQSTPALRAFLRGAVDPLEQVPGVSEEALPAVVDLTRTLKNARPLVEPLALAIANLETTLTQFSPYAGDAGRFFSQHDLLSGTIDGDEGKHYFAAALTGVGLFSVNGLPDPLYNPEYYPCPGTAWNHATVTNCKGGAR